MTRRPRLSPATFMPRSKMAPRSRSMSRSGSPHRQCKLSIAYATRERDVHIPLSFYATSGSDLDQRVDELLQRLIANAFLAQMLHRVQHIIGAGTRLAMALAHMTKLVL